MPQIAGRGSAAIPPSPLLLLLSRLLFQVRLLPIQSRPSSSTFPLSAILCLQAAAAAAAAAASFFLSSPLLSASAHSSLPSFLERQPPSAAGGKGGGGGHTLQARIKEEEEAVQNLWHYTLTTVPSEGVSLALLGASSSLDGAEAVTRKGRGSSEGGYRNSLRIKFTKDRKDEIN